MSMLCDRRAVALAEEWMEESRNEFAPSDYAELVTMLAEDIQSALEGFTDPDYRTITLNALTQRRIRRAEK